jgi:hypothetical protein
MCHCTDRLLWARATGAGWISTGSDRTVYREQRRAWQLVSAARRAADHMVDGTIMISISRSCGACSTKTNALCGCLSRRTAACGAQSYYWWMLRTVNVQWPSLEGA